jgi:hypothetical protein
MPTEDEILQSLRPQISLATLNAVATKAAEARDLEHEISDLEERLKDRKAALRTIYHTELPELLDQAQTDRVGIPASGNMPAVDLRLTPYYNANIWAGWPPERRDAAFKALTDLGHGDLIKTEITVTIPRAERETAQKLINNLTHLGYDPQIRQSVHFKTLTAWLKEQFEHGNPLPPLEVIGAEVGRVVKLIERKKE